MIKRLFERLLLGPQDIQPMRDDFEVIGTFNPGAVRVDGEVVLLVRVAERPAERRDGLTGLPRYDEEEGQIVVDWVPDNALEWIDSRVVRWNATQETQFLHEAGFVPGTVRLTFLSHLRVVRSRDGRSIDSVEGPRFLPQTESEEFGVEDPRITAIGDRFYFTYIAVSRHGAATALASTSDFQTFERHGIIFCPENKDVVLFPEQINGEYVALHRPVGATAFTTPEMWVARSTDLIRWGDHQPLLAGSSAWDSGRIGAGTPPIRTADGWLEIYHGNRAPQQAGEVGTYSAGAMLLDPQNPSRILHRSAEPILLPQAEYECQGFVPNVVFPTGIIETDETLLVYYGAADTHTAVVELSRQEVLAAAMA